MTNVLILQTNQVFTIFKEDYRSENIRNYLKCHVPLWFDPKFQLKALIITVLLHSLPLTLFGLLSTHTFFRLRQNLKSPDNSLLHFYVFPFHHFNDMIWRYVVIGYKTHTTEHTLDVINKIQNLMVAPLKVVLFLYIFSADCTRIKILVKSSVLHCTTTTIQWCQLYWSQRFWNS